MRGMGHYLAIREHVRRTLAELHAGLDLNDEVMLRRDADEALALARRILRRWPLMAMERRELNDLVAAIERIRAVLPLAA